MNPKGHIQQFYVKILFVVGLVLLCLGVNAQVGIGTSSPAVGAILDVDGNGTKGVLFTKVPLISLQNTAPLPVDISDGTLVYNTNSNLETGYYYWDGFMWRLLNATKGVMAKYVNSDPHTEQDLHTDGGNFADILGYDSDPPIFNDDAATYERLNRRTLRVLKAGRYQITVNLSLTATTNKAEVEARLRINGQDAGPYYRSSEMNPLTGSTNGSISFTQTLDLEANDSIRINCKKSNSSNMGTVHLSETGRTSLFIEKLF